jgi:hypothetical protein
MKYGTTWTVEIKNRQRSFDYGFESAPDKTKFYWEAKFRQFILTTDETFKSHQEAIDNFEKIAQDNFYCWKFKQGDKNANGSME